MGVQVNFYMTEADEREFIQFLKSDRDVVIFMDDQPTTDMSCIETLPTKEVPGWFQLWLWDKTNSPRPTFKYLSNRKCYYVDRDRSEVIELDRSSIIDDCLVRGRIWAEMDYWDSSKPPRLIKKSKAFQKWFQRLANWIKRKGTKNDVGEYVFPGAAEYARKGGRLCQAIFDKNVKIIHHDLD